jgi:hypothetical protein
MCLAAVKFSTADGGSFFESGIVNIKLSCRATVEELVLISVHVTAQCERCSAVVRHQDIFRKRLVCSFSFAVFGDDGFPFKAKIRTILVNFPKGFLWYGISICFGMHDLTICIYHQLVMTYFLSLFGKDFWSKKLRSVFREWGKIENSLLFSGVFL